MSFCGLPSCSKEITVWSVVNLVNQVSQTIDFINDTSQIGELKTTMNFVVSSLMPYVDMEKHDTVFYICVHSLIQSLALCKEILIEAYELRANTLPESRCTLSFPSWNFSLFSSSNNPSSATTNQPPQLPYTSQGTTTISHQRKVELYRTDFLINHKILQFVALFPLNSNSATVDSLITDPEAKLFWTTCFSDKAVMIPWKTFFSSFEKYLHTNLEVDEEYFKNFLDFTQDNFVSAFEFAVFMRWFGPIKGCNSRLMDPVNLGILAGFIPACEATNLLQGRECGTFLVRLSKSHLDSFAITFVDNQLQIRHCLLYCAHPHGLTLNNPPSVYPSLMEFIRSHPYKLKHPLGKLIVSASCKARVRACYRPNVPPKEPSSGGFFPSACMNGEEFSSSSPCMHRVGTISTNGTSNHTTPLSTQQPLPLATTTTTTSTPMETTQQKKLACIAPQGCGSSESCVVCLDGPSQTVFLECGHMCCCKICSVKLKQCPMCRADIVRVIPVYRP